MPSSQKWFAVATTTKVVSTGCEATHQRWRLVLSEITAHAITSDHPTCTDGMADSESTEKPDRAYIDWLYCTAVST